MVRAYHLSETFVPSAWDGSPRSKGMVWENYRYIKIAEKPCGNRCFSDLDIQVKLSRIFCNFKSNRNKIEIKADKVTLDFFIDNRTSMLKIN